MKTQTLFIALACICNMAVAQQTSDLTVRFDKMLSEQFNAEATGATVLVARKGEVIYKKAFGKANLELDVDMKPDNIFRIASITKQFTAVAVLQLMEQGKFMLQDEITKFIPDYPVRGNKITIEHLLTHTSGITDFSALRDTVRSKGDLTPTQMIDLFKNLPMRFTPGTKWEYSNSGYFLLGYIIEKVSGRSYGQYLDEHIFKPLKMTHSEYANDSKIIKGRATGYTHGEAGFENAPYLSMTHPYAAGAILSTVEDLFTWQQAVLSGKLIKKENLTKAFTRYRLADGKETAYGYGWRTGQVYNSTNLWHGGLINGFMSMAMYLPKEDVYVAILSNCDCNSPEIVASKLAALAAGRAVEYKEKPVDEKTLQNYTGVYENEKGQQRIITVNDRKLFSQLGRGPKSQIVSYENDKFYFDGDPMSTMEFEKYKSASIDKLITINLRGTDTWKKTGKPIPDENGIIVNEDLLDTYMGEYEVSPDFSFAVRREKGKLFLQAPGQEKLEMFAETPNTFFLKVNDATFEFVKDSTGKTVKVILKQSGRVMEAKKVK